VEFIFLTSLRAVLYHRPGDRVEVTGVFLPKPHTGFKAMRAGLVTNTFVEAMAVKQDKQRYAESVIPSSVLSELNSYRKERDVYGRLAQSIAPEIFGHNDVKKSSAITSMRWCHSLSK